MFYASSFFLLRCWEMTTFSIWGTEDCCGFLSYFSRSFKLFSFCSILTLIISMISGNWSIVIWSSSISSMSSLINSYAWNRTSCKNFLSSLSSYFAYSSSLLSSSDDPLSLFIIFPFQLFSNCDLSIFILLSWLWIFWWS